MLSPTGMTRVTKIPYLLVGILFGSLTLANLYYMLVERTYPYLPVSRETVMGIKETPRVIGNNVLSRGLLEIVLNSTNSADEWTVKPDEGDPYEITAPYPHVKMLNGTHSYKISSKNELSKESISFTFTMEYTPGEVFKTAARTKAADNYRISHISIPVWKNKTFFLEDWCGWDLKEDELEKAKMLLPSFDNNDMSSTDIIKVLGKWLLDSLDNKRGVPSKKMQEASPLESYKMAKAGKSGIWCTNFAGIYNLFSNALGIKTRRVSAGGTLDKVKYSNHAFCESYIPEQGRWACVDLNSRILYAADHEGRVMNTMRLADILQANSINLSAVVYRDGGLTETAYDQVCSPHRQYFNRNALFFYRLPGRHGGDLMRYFSKPSTFVLSRHHIPGDYTKRMILISLWGLSALIFAAFIIAAGGKRTDRPGTAGE